MTRFVFILATAVLCSDSLAASSTDEEFAELAEQFVNDFRLGAELYDKKFPFALNSSVNRKGICPRADSWRTDFGEQRLTTLVAAPYPGNPRVSLDSHPVATRTFFVYLYRVTGFRKPHSCPAPGLPPSLTVVQLHRKPAVVMHPHADDRRLQRRKNEIVLKYLLPSVQAIRLLDGRGLDRFKNT